MPTSCPSNHDDIIGALIADAMDTVGQGRCHHDRKGERYPRSNCIPSTILSEVSSERDSQNLVDAGVIDPTKVVRVALQNAASVASLLLTTEAAAWWIPETSAA